MTSEGSTTMLPTVRYESVKGDIDVYFLLYFISSVFHPRGSSSLKTVVISLHKPIFELKIVSHCSLDSSLHCARRLSCLAKVEMKLRRELVSVTLRIKSLRNVPPDVNTFGSETCSPAIGYFSA